ncbi:hypothetical protein C3F34_13345 [Acinetobacter sp. ACNIH2]|uniref:hypothetical protein n=1 Tax=unclassified Acinetobacter TaxID=196816 RepID=UPI000CDC76BF|nr:MULTISPECIES: hypothetical protein [unclassified Acinetobacter]AUX86920.1 hypothetical protein C3F34_13345 [Acinetobacter sp. ACNIH2]UOG18693.1 hypothetical protein MP622_03515 [Acinetobacter sp. PK01]
MKLAHKIMLGGMSILLIYLLFKLIVWQYEAYNERRGFCTAEGKYLTEEEKLQNLKVDLIVALLEDWSKNYDDNWDANLYISKYDLNDEEKIIELMAKSDINKSLEENFGFIAIGSMPEYFARDQLIHCRFGKGNCGKSLYNFDRTIMHSLFNEDNKIDITYLKNLPKDYSFVTDWGRGSTNLQIYPLSSVQKIENKLYKLRSYDIYKFCCDRDFIDKLIKYNNVPISRKNRDKTENEGAYNQEELDLRLDQVDGEIIDDFYILDLYKDRNLALDHPNQVQKFGLFWSAGALRKPAYANKYRKIFVTACGMIAETE